MKTILLIEDEIEYENTADYPMVRALQRAGYEVDVARNGDRAINMLELKEYDIVILDIMLPHGNGTRISRDIPRMGLGKEVLRQLVNKELKPSGTKYDVPVIVVSGVIDFEDVTDIIKMLKKEDWYMTKPREPNEVVELVKRVLKG